MSTTVSKPRPNPSTFGSSINTRSFSAGSGFRFGFVEQENDNEISGVENNQEHLFRCYDMRLGRYKSMDPLGIDFPWNSPYSYAENRVVDGYDLEGREWENFMTTFSNVESLKPKLPNTNNGEIQLQVYKTVVSNCGISFKGIKDIFTQTPEKILSNSKATFTPIPKEINEQFKLEVDANFRIDIDGPMNNSFVRVTKVEIGEKIVSATFTTLEGHVEAGVIKFTIEEGPVKGQIVFTINGVSQVDFGMVTDLYARTEQSASWFEVLQNFNDVSKGLEVLRSVNITSQIAESDDGAIKEVSINRTVKRGSKDFEKQASETIDAIEQAKGN